MARDIKDATASIANLLTTLIDCVYEIVRAIDDDELSQSVAAKMGAFVLSEHREDGQ